MKECNIVKQSPIAGLAAYGGGAGSVIFGRKGVDGYLIQKAVRFNSADSAYLTRTPSTSGNRRTFTFACWIKRTKLVNCGSSGQEIFRAGDSAYSAMNFAPSDGPCDALSFKADQSGVGPGSATNAVFRDFSAWFHVVYRIDTTQSTASNRVRVYVNGVEQTWHTTNYPSQNQELKFNQSGQQHYIGGTEYFDGYLADIHFIDGQSLGPSSFGELNSDGIWDPKEFTGSFGTNGFHLFDFANEATIGHDSSGNNNDFTAYNINATAPTNSGPFTAANAYTGTTGNNYGSTDGAWNSAFDGSTSNGVTVNNANGETILTMVNSASWSSSIRIRRQYILGNVDGWVKLNTTEISGGGSSSQWVDVTSTMGSSGTLTSVGIRNYARLFAIELDGVILTDTMSAAQQDLLRDVPTNGNADDDTGAGGQLSSNYPTMNGLAKHSNTTLTNGNLDVSSTAVYTTVSTIGFPSTGKYYAEFRINGTASGYPFVGIGAFNDAGISGNYNPNTGAFYAQGGYVTGSVSVSGLTALSAGDIVGVAYDTSNGKVWFSINGTYVSSGNPAAGTNATCTLSANVSGYCLATSTYQAGTVSLNAGQRAFNTNAPSGFKCLCTTNLPDPTIANGADHFDIALWTGNGSTQSITGLEFSPDLVWIKMRSAAAGHRLYDAVRGATKYLVPQGTDAEATQSAGLTSFDSSGFSLGSNFDHNNNNSTFVGWSWNSGANSNKTYAVKVVSDSGNKYRFDDFGTSAVTLNLEEGSTYVFDQSDSSNSGHPLRFSTTSNGTHGGGSEYTTGVTTTGTPGSAGAKTTIVVAASAPTLYYYCSNHSGMGGQANTNSTAGSSNFDGNIQSTLKANPESGFSIVAYSGNGSSSATVGHGLNAQLGMLIQKRRDDVASWKIKHTSLATNHQLLFTSAASVNVTGLHGGGMADLSSSSTFGFAQGLTNVDNVNGNNVSYIVYCFAPVAGFSAFGSYVGNGSTDGRFIHTGFRPRWVMLKNRGASYSWYIYDTSRDTYNVMYNVLIPNTANADTIDPDYSIDVLSNGFKCRTNNVRSNASGNTYIYAAFAEHPFKTARAR